MRISTFWFCMKQGLVNICRNIWFSLASTAIISACIFLFCVFFSVITNIEYMVRTAETTMGITVFFDENLTEDEIKDIGAKIESDKSGIIKEIKFVSAEEAWDRASISGTRRHLRKDLRTIILLRDLLPMRSA